MNDTFPPSADMSKNAHVDSAKYDAMYAASIADPDAFWQEQGARIDWIKPFTAVKNVDYSFGNVDIKWYADGTLNVAAIASTATLQPAAIKRRSFLSPTTPKRPRSTSATTS